MEINLFSILNSRMCNIFIFNKILKNDAKMLWINNGDWPCSLDIVHINFFSFEPRISCRFATNFVTGTPVVTRPLFPSRVPVHRRNHRQTRHAGIRSSEARGLIINPLGSLSMYTRERFWRWNVIGSRVQPDRRDSS